MSLWKLYYYFHGTLINNEIIMIFQIVISSVPSFRETWKNTLMCCKSEIFLVISRYFFLQYWLTSAFYPETSGNTPYEEPNLYCWRWGICFVLICDASIIHYIYQNKCIVKLSWIFSNKTCSGGLSMYVIEYYQSMLCKGIINVSYHLLSKY